MNIAEFRDWKNKLDSSLKEQSDRRHDFASIVAESIDRMRLELYDRDEDMSEQAKLLARHRIILDGLDPNTGLMAQVRLMGLEIERLNTWKTQSKAFIAGVTFISSLLGGAVVFIIKHIFTRIPT